MDNMTTAHDVQELTSGEAALIIGCTSETVRDLATRGHLRWRRLDNGGWVFPLDDVLVLAEARRRKPETRGRPVKLRKFINQISSARSGLQGPAPAIGLHAGTRSIARSITSSGA